MGEYDEELDFMYFRSACLEFHPTMAPGPWEWQVCHWWPYLSPTMQVNLVRFATMVGMELHPIGRGLALIYNPQRPTRWSIIKRILHDTFRSSVSKS